MRFDVLSPSLEVNQSRLIEASAGTGKTFALEHLTLRWLLSSAEASLDKVALITFTRKSALDLRARLRARFEKAYDELRQGPCQSPYLQGIEQDKRELALLKLIESLMNFDLMPISTIHAFAAKLLSRSGWFFEEIGSTPFEKEYLHQLIELHLESFHLETTKSSPSLSKDDSIVLKMVEQLKWNVDVLTEEIAGALSKGLEIGLPTLGSLDVWKTFFEDDENKPSFDRLLKDSCQFKGSYFRDGTTIKPFHRRQLDHWKLCLEESRILDEEKLISLLQHFQKANLKSRPTDSSKDLAFWFESKKEALDLLLKSSLKKRGLEILAARLRKSLSPLFKKDFRLGHDVVLKRLEDALESAMGPNIAKSLDLLIVDEFQDTDPTQWKLFQRLSQLNPSLQIILVGDPKQSIYGFRQADIYTYLAAKDYVKNNLKGSADELTTNYRSHPYLVETLNELFAASEAGCWLKLPRLNSYLPCPKVFAGREKSQENAYAREKTRVHFHDLDSHQTSDPLEAGADWIDYEYKRLKGLGLKSFAILVSQHDKGRKIQKLLAERGLRSHIQKPLAFANLPSFEFFRLILEAFEKPYLNDRMKRLWSHPLWQLSHSEREGILGHQFTGSQSIEFSLNNRWILFWQELTKLHQVLLEKGVGAFWQRFWQLEIGETPCSLYERLMRCTRGFEIYDQMNALWLWLETEQSHLFAKEALKRLEELEASDSEESALYYPMADEQAIHILTVHASKGLEYEVVFCLSNLISKGPSFQRWMQIYHEEGPRCVAFETDHPSYLDACDEIDAEKARRLYVAWTRSREYLLIGYQSQKRRLPPKRSQATAFELFTASWQKPNATNIAELYKIFEEEEPSSRFFDHLRLLQQQKKIALTSCVCLLQENQMNLDLAPVKEIEIKDACDLKQRELFIQKAIWHRGSFSSLLNQSKAVAAAFFEEKKDGWEEPHLEMDEMAIVPRGTEVGTLWHLLFQRALQFLQRGMSLDTIAQRLRNESFLQGNLHFEVKEHYLGMTSQVVKLLDKSWDIPLEDRTLSFCFAKLPRGSIWTEKNFELSSQEVECYLKGKIQLGRDPVQLNGVIDAIVHLPEGILFIDWKSNWVAPQADLYNQETVLKNALEHRYDLQALIYQRAIESSLLVKRGRPLIAGLYIYIRGSYPLVWSVSKSGF